MQEITKVARGRYGFAINFGLARAIAGYWEAICFTDGEAWEEVGGESISIWEAPHSTFERILMDVSMAYGMCSQAGLDHAGGSEGRYSWEQFGRDVWFERTGSGVGFHDRIELDSELADGYKAITERIFGKDISIYWSEDVGPIFHD